MSKNTQEAARPEDDIDSDSTNILPDTDEKENEAGIEVILREIGAFVRFVGHRFGEDRCFKMAAGLSYTSLLAIVPLTAIAFSMLAAFPVFSGVREAFQDAMFSNLLPHSADVTQEYFTKFVKNTTTLSAVGIVALAATAVLLLGTIEADMNAIFRVARKRALAPRLLVFWALLTLGPLLLGASFSLSTYFFAATKLIGIDTGGGFAAFFGTFLPTIMIIILLTVFYIIIPNRPVGITAGLSGGIIAGVGFTILRKIFGWYIVSFPTYQNIYGAMSVVPIFLVWMYLSWLLVLLGALLTASVSEWQSAGGKPLSSNVGTSMRLIIAVQILAVLFEASRDGSGAVHRSRILRSTGGGGEAVDRILNQLRAAQYTDRTAANRWILARNPETVTLFDLHQVLGLGFSGYDFLRSDEPWRRRLVERVDALRESNHRVLNVTLKELIEAETDMPAAREIAR
ncbi:MAG: YihY family inner membrane protein [Rhodospirillales bacterium]